MLTHITISPAGMVLSVDYHLLAGAPVTLTCPVTPNAPLTPDATRQAILETDTFAVTFLPEGRL